MGSLNKKINNIGKMRNNIKWTSKLEKRVPAVKQISFQITCLILSSLLPGDKLKKKTNI